MIGLCIVQHLLIHYYLLAEGFLNAISFLLQLREAFLHESVEGLELSDFAAALLYFSESGHLSVHDVVSELAGSVCEVSPGCLPIFFRGEIGEFGWGDLSPYLRHQQALHKVFYN